LRSNAAANTVTDITTACIDDVVDAQYKRSRSSIVDCRSDDGDAGVVSECA
jgi:hypothetical protein